MAHAAPSPSVVRRLRSSWSTVAAFTGTAAVTIALAVPAFAVDHVGAHPQSRGTATTAAGQSASAYAPGFGLDAMSTYHRSLSGSLDPAWGDREAGTADAAAANSSEVGDSTAGSDAGTTSPTGEESGPEPASGSDAEAGGDAEAGPDTETGPGAESGPGESESNPQAPDDAGSRAVAGAGPEPGAADDLPGGEEARRDLGGRADRSGDERGSIRVRGMDISSFQPTVDWDHWWGQGKRFVFIKATEGTNFESPTYDWQWRQSKEIGMLRGAYHFALPDGPTGAAQARFFVENGGGGKADGSTLPGVLDIEFGEAVGRPTCYNRSPSQIVAWTRDFLTTYTKLTGRTPIIYTNANWWRDCTNDSTAFRDYPLWIASYNPTAGDLPGGWEDFAFWQFTDTPLDQNVFYGSYDELKALARP